MTSRKSKPGPRPVTQDDLAIRGDRVKALRLELKMTQAECGHASALTEKQIRDIENRRRDVSVRALRRLVLTLDTTADHLLGLDDRPRR